jgi:CheY-like chemotaxis protein
MTAQKPRLLVVDDDPEAFDMLEDVLGDEFDLAKASGADAAIAALADPALKLAIVDYMMPGGNGLTVAKAIVERRKGLPVMLFSAYLASDVQAWGDLTLRVVSKADGPEELLRAIRELLGAAPAGAQPAE